MAAAAAAAAKAAEECVIDTSRGEECRDSRAAAHLKLVSICVILGTSLVGILGPILLARIFRGRPTRERAVHVIKCFAAGVILSTAVVHILPDAFSALSDCYVAARHPWKDFPFGGLVTLIGALLGLLVDVASTSSVRGGVPGRATLSPPYARIGTSEDSGRGVSLMAGKLSKSRLVREDERDEEEEEDEEDLGKMRQRVMAQVMEIGIMFYSVIIGVTMGMSRNRCTIKPLIAALAFHQIFEAMGLGGCIAQVMFYFQHFLFLFFN